MLRQDGVSGYVVEGFGGLHPFGGAPYVPYPYYAAADFTRAVALNPGTGLAVTADRYGGVAYAFCAGDRDCDSFGENAIVGHPAPANIDTGSDNCLSTPNSDQRNYDGNFIELGPTKAFDDLTRPNSDALGDACDEDDDNDGLTDVDELSGAACGGIITDPLKEDTDGDRVLDGAECALGTDPTNPASFPSAAACGAVTDADGDGVAAFREYCYYNTDPNNANTDGDTCDDGKEIASINADTAVNVIDLSQIAGAFGPAPGPPYIVQFDVNKDGAINVLDLSFVAGRFGVC
jgi:hypothetical protein